ncbi:hypothetical protein GCM10009846_25670 [Agrococcus versicolor]|uniref:Uncharacterized protein n=1 Tax=Agrococcus versicolor TaxID=501482 RepID=A0ABN3AVV6_9MICO
MYGPPQAVRLAFDTAAPTLALAVPLAVVALVAGIAVLTAASGALAVVDHAVAPVRPGPAVLGAAAVLSAALSLGLGLGVTAATLALLARVDRRRLGVLAALAGAARRPGSVLLATAVALVTSLAVAGIVGVLLPLQPVAGIAAAVGVVVVAVVAAPLLLAFPLVVGGRMGLGPAIGWAWRSPHAIVAASAEPLRTPRIAVVVTVVATGVASLVLQLLGGLVPTGWWTPVVQVALALVPGALAQVLLAAVAVRGVALRLDGPVAVEGSEPSTAVATPAIGALASALASGDATPSSAPGATEAPARTRTRRTGPLAGIAVLLVPAIVAGALLAANPWGVPAYAAADVHRIWSSPQVATWEGGTAVLSRLGGQDSTVRLCSASTCGPEHDMRAILPSTIAPAADGGLLSATWYPIEDAADEESGSFELRVVHSSPSELREWDQPVEEVDDVDDADADRTQPWAGLPGDERMLGGIDVSFQLGTSAFDRINESLMAVAIDSSGEAPVIASVVRPLDSQDATLAIDACADATCSVSQRTELDLEWGSWSTSSTTLDVATTAGGTTVVSLADRADDDGEIALRLVTLATDGTSTIESLDAEVPGDVVTDLDQTHGAQVAIGGDGLPLVLVRAVDRATLRLLACLDVACSDATITDVEPATDVLHSPALVVDASGRPLIGTIDAEGNVALLSCDDAACASWTSVALAGTAPSDAGSSLGFALALDDDGRPLLAVGARRAVATDAADAGVVLACAAVRCGAD